MPWARNVGQEFAQQVAKERAAKMDVSAFMDVKNDFELAKLQVGFISFVIKPFFEKVRAAKLRSLACLSVGHSDPTDSSLPTHCLAQECMVGTDLLRAWWH
eukprot:COSAG05_NODE_1147_length_5730_cov_3.054520_2_plen_101_part_00